MVAGEPFNDTVTMQTEVRRQYITRTRIQSTRWKEFNDNDKKKLPPKISRAGGAVVVAAEVVAVVAAAAVVAAVVAAAAAATAGAGEGAVAGTGGAVLAVGVTTGTLVSGGFIAKRSSSGAASALPSDGAKGSWGKESGDTYGISKETDNREASKL